MVIRTVDVKDFSFIMMQKTKSQMQFHKGGSGSQGGSALVSRSAALINQKCHVKNKDISGSLVFGIGGQAKVAGTLFGIGGSLVFTFWKGGYLFKGFVKRPLINITVGSRLMLRLQLPIAKTRRGSQTRPGRLDLPRQPRLRLDPPRPPRLRLDPARPPRRPNPPRPPRGSLDPPRPPNYEFESLSVATMACNLRSIGFDWVVMRLAGGWSVVVIVVRLACSGCWVVFDDSGFYTVENDFRNLNVF
ncbi:PREDICTED: WAT1-related [Prunus dulcis]|uniref:PREDICTED: WAT1-related n=1 Tax=Prunus dulcis TaxID=3755 RepID=A0A5E4F1G5_PRUDU|nr:PREDICTED: WAT1-related [Prunus dulcis]